MLQNSLCTPSLLIDPKTRLAGESVYLGWK
jgi:hypothetical protein